MVFPMDLRSGAAKFELMVMAWVAIGCHGVCYDSGNVRGTWGGVISSEEWDAYVESANGDREEACKAACENWGGHQMEEGAEVTGCEWASWTSDDSGEPTKEQLECRGIVPRTASCE